MWEPQRFIDTLDIAISSAVGTFQKEALRAQRRIARRLLDELSALDRTKEGFIKNTVANIKLTNKIKKRLPGLMIDDSFRGAVDRLANEIGKIETELNTFLLEVFGSDFNPAKPIFKALQENAILLTRNTLTEAGLGGMLTNEIEGIINANLNGGVAWRDMVAQITGFIEGPGSDLGMVARFAKTTIRDGIAQYSRNYLLTAAKGMKVEWFYYTGPKVEDSREFCLKRKGKYFTLEEIQSWADLSWAGKNKMTNKSNIIVLLGGYGCIDQAIPVPQEFVPAADIARAESRGFAA